MKSKFKLFSRISDSESILFDFFRGLSAYLVLFSHLWQTIWDRNDIDHTGILYVFAANAVMIFFVLSGYMITNSIYRNTSEYRFVNFNYTSFIKDRLVRLYPPLIFAFIIVFIVYILAKLFDLPGRFEIHFYEICGNLLFIQDVVKIVPVPVMNNPLWSLSYEFWFYVIGALVSIVIVKRNFKFILLIGVFFLLLFFFGNYKTFISGFIVWISGSFIAIQHQNGYFSRSINSSRTYFLFVLVISLYVYTVFSTGLYSHLLHSFSKYIFGMCFALLLSILLRSNKVRNNSLKKNILFTFIAKSAAYSYTLYIIHWPLLLLFNGLAARIYSNSIPIKLLITIFSALAVVIIAKESAKVTENKNKTLANLYKVKLLFRNV